MDKYLTPEQEATSLTTRPERLEELANDYSTTRRVLRIIASNPNTPKEILFKLGEDFTQEIFNNPVLGLLLLENPHLITEMPYNTVISLLKLDSKFEFWAVETVVRRSDWLDIFEKIEIPTRLLKVLAHSYDYKVRSWVGENSNTPVNILIMLTNDKESIVRKSVASNPNTPIDFIKIFSNDDECVRLGVASNPNTPQYLLKLYSTHDEHVRACIGSNPSTPLDVLKILSQDTIFNVRASLVNNKNTPASILTDIFPNFEDIFKCFSEENSYLNTMNKLQNLNFQTKGYNIRDWWENYFGFRLAFASHPNTPGDILDILATDDCYYDAVAVQVVVAENLNTTANTLRKLSQDICTLTRCNVASNPNTPIDILETLCHDDEPFVRMSMALNPNIPPNILEILSRDTIYVRMFVAKNPNTPAHVLKILSPNS
ncbi:hypothetical protein CAL7716_058940 [Calothrix sp. PCC 7716]|nr:hypothetical protein CAL7716_058940 [Calothrix sp. PCC 7716]